MNKKNKNKTTLGQYITIFSFLALLVWVITLNIGKTRAQGEKFIELEFKGDEEKIPVPELNTSYIESQPREEEFFEGAKCEQANLDCFTKIRQSSEMTGWKAQLVGAPSEEEGGGGEEPTSLFNDTAKIFSMLYTPQASANYYVADFLDNMGIISPAYAQGLGYFALSPYLSIWRVFRNFAYACFTGIILVIGIMILFRQNFGGQAAVTAQQALPRVVVALLMVTFSYAIAGFLIDLMYWIMYAFASFTNLNGGAASEVINLGFGGLAATLLIGKVGDIFSAVNAIAGSFFVELMPDALDWFGKGLGYISGMIGTVVILIAMLFALFRVLFILLKSYAYVLLNIIFAPFFLMLHALPGVNTFKKWIMSIVSNLSPFVMVFFLLVVVGTLNKYFGDKETTDGGFAPPYMIGNAANYGSPKVLGSIIGLAILLALPEIIENVKKKLGGDAGFMGEMANAAWGNFNKARTSRPVKALHGVAGGTAGLAATIPGVIAAGSGNRAKYFQSNYQSNVVKGARSGVFAGLTNPIATSVRERLVDYNKLKAKAENVKLLGGHSDAAKAADNWLTSYGNYKDWVLAGRPEF